MLKNLRIGVQFVLMTTMIVAVQGGGIPVFDQSNMMHQVKELAHLVEQMKTLQQQLDQAKEHYQALTGNRGFGQRFYDPALRQALPTEWQKVYDAIKEGGQGEHAVQDVLQQETFSGSVDEMQQHIGNRQHKTTATHKAMALKAYQSAQDRQDQIDDLMGAIDETDDPKAIAELQARIAIEQAALSNERNKLQLISQLQRSEDQLIDQQKAEMSRRIFDPNNPKVPELKSTEGY